MGVGLGLEIRIASQAERMRLRAEYAQRLAMISSLPLMIALHGDLDDEARAMIEGELFRRANDVIRQNEL